MANQKCWIVPADDLHKLPGWYIRLTKTTLADHAYKMTDNIKPDEFWEFCQSILVFTESFDLNITKNVIFNNSKDTAQ